MGCVQQKSPLKAHADEFFTTWNCRKTVLILTPRRHLMKAKFTARKFFDTRLTVIGASKTESVPGNIFGIHSFDGLVTTKQTNCFAFDFLQVQV